MYSNSYGRVSGAHFDMIRRRVDACGVYQILSNDVTFEARPLCNLTRCTALGKSDIPKKKIDNMIKYQILMG